jgi:phosphodiesterase/alkaline phosphatase D-like protein
MEHDADPADPAAPVDPEAGSGGGSPRRRRLRPPTTATALRVVAGALGLGAVVFLWLDDDAGWLDYRPGGTAFFTYVRPAAYVLIILGVLLALKWEVAGAVVSAFAAAAVGAFAVNQLVGWHAVLVIGLFAVPSVLWLVADSIDWTRRRIASGVLVVVLAALAGGVTGDAVYQRAYGPTHPESDTVAPPDSATRWIWSGGVTDTTARVRARTQAQPAETRLAVTTDAAWERAFFVDTTFRDGPLRGFDIANLEPDTTYDYALEVEGELDLVRTGRFHTFPQGPSSFLFTIGACARVGSNGSVFDTIRSEDPLFHLITGDFHYGDIPEDDRQRYDDVIDLTLRQPAQAALYRSTPVAYVWDDHDYGVNDADSFSPSRLAALAAYQANVPSYDLATPVSPIYQRFDVGRVRFLLTDARSARIPGQSMLGGEQLEWLLEEFVTASSEQALVVWVNPIPWVAEEDEGADHWGGYPEERRLIADTIADHEIDNLLMISGDAHMVAIDDGTNTDYSSAGTGGFPLLHAAPLDRPGSIKGGPYSHGAVDDSGQYGAVEVDDTGDAITVQLRAMRYDGEVQLSYRFTIDR